MLTALILLLVTTAMSVVLLFVLTSLITSKAAGVREWTQAHGLAVLALLLIAARGVVPDILSVEVANAMLLLTFGLAYIGFRRHLSLPVARWPLAVGGVLTLGGIAYFHYVVDSLALRTMIASVYHAVVCFAIVATIPSTMDPHLRFPFAFTRMAALALGAAHTFRGAFYAVQGLAPSSQIDVATWNLVLLSIGTLALPALTLGAVMMANAQVRREAAYAADHDGLTGAWSRRAFLSLAEREHARAERRCAALSLLVFEADHFRDIGDAHGRVTAERVLVDVVMQTKEVIRKIDDCGRLDGERFAVLLPDAGRAVAMEVAARLSKALERPLPPAPPAASVACTVSIGVATLALGESLASLMARADAALDAARTEGRNRVSVAPLPPRVEHAPA